MKFSVNQYAKALYESASENPKRIPEIAKNLYFHLSKNRQVKNLPPILNRVDEIAKEKQGIIEVEIETARPFERKFQEKIRKIFDKKVLFKEKIRPEILGGLILRWDENVFDGSIKGAFSKIKENL